MKRFDEKTLMHRMGRSLCSGLLVGFLTASPSLAMDDGGIGAGAVRESTGTGKVAETQGRLPKPLPGRVASAANPPASPSEAAGKDRPAIEKALRRVPEADRKAVGAALTRAGKNDVELASALEKASDDELGNVVFLIANMPDRDLKTLGADSVLENVRLSQQARAKAPWGKRIPDEIYRNCVLPYANVTERRGAWRNDFFDRFGKRAWQIDTPGEAARMLNATAFKELNVRYHARKRTRPDQSPAESVKTGFASCTGLSILLADACRAVGVPARLVGIPCWKQRITDGAGQHGGNHTWVEIWDDGWHYLGAAEPNELDRAWFTQKCRTAVDPSHSMHCIYAVSFRKTDRFFPMVWAPQVRYISAEDVTQRYQTPVEAKRFQEPFP